MPIQKITIQEFLHLSKHHAMLDVRSPAEYTHAHIPNAINLPLFTDEERKVVGTTYKQQSKQAAIKIGLDYFGVNMKAMIEEVEKINFHFIKANVNAHVHASKNEGVFLVHCWRGGMRSAGVAWLLDLYGFTVYTLIGGYKAYRNWVIAQFEKDYPFKIIGGYTGSGKTLLLHQLKKENKKIIDLELLANHKGSAFGALGQAPQPSQEMFENLLAKELSIGSLQLIDNNTPKTISHQPLTIFVEDESQRIGNLQIPLPLWKKMRNSIIYFLDIPFDERLNYIIQEYGKFEKEKLVNAIMRIQKKLGGLETKNAINFLLENNYTKCFCILLNYYDKLYNNSLHKREKLSALLKTISCQDVNAKINSQYILSANE